MFVATPTYLNDYWFSLHPVSEIAFILLCFGFVVFSFLRTKILLFSAGILLILSAYILSFALNFQIAQGILDDLLVIFSVVIIIAYSQDIRRGLDALVTSTSTFTGKERLASYASNEITDTAVTLANKQIGALIAIQKDYNLHQYVQDGIPIGAYLTKELLISTFLPASPLHDGALIVSDDKIISAGNILPLTSRTISDTQLGTRHRAGIGITEITDCLCLIVSEERGIISLAYGGRILSDMDPEVISESVEQFIESGKQPKIFATTTSDSSLSEHAVQY